MPERLDKIMVARGFCESRTQAQHLISAGLVAVRQAGQWLSVTKPSTKCDTEIELRCEQSEEHRFVSRAGLKLEAALNASCIDVTGLNALDIGQSTGGFTDCLLQNGASTVVGVDVGHDQLSATLRQDKRVTCLEGVNARHMPTEALLAYQSQGFDLAVMDVSFISQKLILPGIPSIMKPGGLLVSLVKPQFELTKEAIGKGGIVKEPALYQQVEGDIKALVTSLGLSVVGFIESPIKGGDGNKEFVLTARYN